MAASISFQQTTFLGATIVEFSQNGTWDEQGFNLNIKVVEDPANGDDFLLSEANTDNLGGALMNTPQLFQYGSYSFTGILLSYDRVADMNNYPTYNVVLSSPHKILSGTQVILAGYVGPGNDSLFNGGAVQTGTFQVSNFLNVYGYAEDGGAQFGRSLITETGLFWTGEYGVAACIEALTNTPPPANINDQYFGSYLVYKNNYYKVDLSGLPTPPSYYTIGGAVSMTLLELISRFCQDGGVNYIPILTLGQGNGPHTISFLTVARLNQPQLGQVTQFINQQTLISSVTHGEEQRDDITQAMIVGGQVTYLQPMANSSTDASVIAPFFGFDFNGFPILGQKPDGTMLADDSLSMNLNASKIADIMGELGYGLSYPCTILELRCALSNYDVWCAYIRINKTNLANQLNLYGSYDFSVGNVAEILTDLLFDGEEAAVQFANIYGDNHWPAVAQRFYDYVREQAETYYGRQFLVQLPYSIKLKIVPQSLQIQFSDELADAGYMPEGSDILGLNYVNENYFLDDTGRFYPLVSFAGVSTFNSVAGTKTVVANLGSSSSESTVVQNAGTTSAVIYLRCEQGVDGPTSVNGQLSGGSQIFYAEIDGIAAPVTVVTIPSPIFAQADDMVGSVADLASILNTNVGQLQYLLALKGTANNIFIHPPAMYPNGVSVALKSNQYLYGPWGKFSANGRLEFEQDEGLTPWDCGDYDTMTQVANAKLLNIATGNQVLERAQIEEVGIPSYNLGQTLFQDGPIINGISVNIGMGGVKTTYTLETFVNRVGAFVNENANLLRRIGKIYQQMRRSIRQQLIESVQRASIMNANYNGWMYGTTYALQDHTPHGVLGASLFYSNLTSGYVPITYTQTHQEAFANIRANSSGIFQSSACMGLEGLIRPYTTNANNANLPWMFKPDPFITKNVTSPITSNQLNPFVTGCDINYIVTGDTYSHLNSRIYPQSIDYSNLRAIALRGPMMVQGWGYDIQGLPVPNAATPGAATGTVYPLQQCGNSFRSDYLSNSLNWPTAVLDLRYNKFTGTWGSNGLVLTGMVSGANITPGGVGTVALYANGKAMLDTIDAYNFFVDSSATIGTGYRVMLGYNSLDNRWYITQAACNPG